MPGLADADQRRLDRLVHHPLIARDDRASAATFRSVVGPFAFRHSVTTPLSEGHRGGGAMTVTALARAEPGVALRGSEAYDAPGREGS
jgi:hypothetical protein